jgi:hypothetical protein
MRPERREGAFARSPRSRPIFPEERGAKNSPREIHTPSPQSPKELGKSTLLPDEPQRRRRPTWWYYGGIPFLQHPAGGVRRRRTEEDATGGTGTRHGPPWAYLGEAMGRIICGKSGCCRDIFQHFGFNFRVWLAIRSGDQFLRHQDDQRQDQCIDGRCCNYAVEESMRRTAVVNF